ncbi:MAG: hypothetical protein HKP61_04660, partial [Dactylosporangium sp.]|nr:hypothetical protein [Dactylosporangium sp.]NNJ60238.1 hypothetical protein [Dactylosporangium sp.]
MSTKQTEQVAYFAVVDPGGSVATPRQVLRRRSAGRKSTDEALDGRGEWGPSRELAEAERGRVPGELRPLAGVLAEALVAQAREE